MQALPGAAMAGASSFILSCGAPTDNLDHQSSREGTTGMDPRTHSGTWEKVSERATAIQQEPYHEEALALMTASDTAEKAISLLASHRMARVFVRLARLDDKHLDLLIKQLERWLGQQQREREAAGPIASLILTEGQ